MPDKSTSDKTRLKKHILQKGKGIEMKRTDKAYQDYVQILKEELLPAMGCTEPIAIAFAAAKAVAVLGKRPERLLCEVSGNIIKNVKSVVVPHTGGLRGIPAAAAAGAVAGDADAELEVISNVTPEQIKQINEFLGSAVIEVKHVNNGHIFDIAVTAFAGEETSCVRIVDYHTNIVLIRKGDEILFEKDVEEPGEGDGNGLTDREFMTIEGIVEFAD